MTFLDDPWDAPMEPGEAAAAQMRWELPGGAAWLSVAPPPEALLWDDFPQQLARQEQQDSFILLRRFARRDCKLAQGVAPCPTIFGSRPITERRARELVQIQQLMHPAAAFQLLRTPDEFVLAEPLRLGPLQDLQAPYEVISNRPMQAHIVAFIIAIGEQLAPLHARQMAHLHLTTDTVTVTQSGPYLSGFDVRLATGEQWQYMRALWGVAAPEVSDNLPGSRAPAADIWQLAVCVLTWLELWPSEGWSKPDIALIRLNQYENSTYAMSPFCDAPSYNKAADFQAFWCSINKFEPRLRDLLKSMLKEDPCERPCIQRVLQQCRCLQPGFRKIRLVWQKLRHHNGEQRCAGTELLQYKFRETVHRPASLICQGTASLTPQQVQCRVRRWSDRMVNLGVGATAAAVGVMVGIALWSQIPLEIFWLTFPVFVFFSAVLTFFVGQAIIERINSVVRPLPACLPSTRCRC